MPTSMRGYLPCTRGASWSRGADVCYLVLVRCLSCAFAVVRYQAPNMPGRHVWGMGAGVCRAPPSRQRLPPSLCRCRRHHHRRRGRFAEHGVAGGRSGAVEAEIAIVTVAVEAEIVIVAVAAGPGVVGTVGAGLLTAVRLNPRDIVVG